MGKQSGKLGQSVLSTRYGEQIQRAYVKEIANPKTEAQVATRSRFKLASQLSAVMADVIAIPRVGSKTGRNQFVSATMDITSEAAGVAQVDLNSVQLTKSQRGLIGFTATRDTANDKISIVLKGANGSELSRVVYVAFEKQNDGSLVQLASQVVSIPGANNTFPADLKGSTKSVVLYAYGMTDKDGAASVKFGNLNAPTAEQVAKLLTTSSDTLSGVSLTKTNGATMNEGKNSCDSDDVRPTPRNPIITEAYYGQDSWNQNVSNMSRQMSFMGQVSNADGLKMFLICTPNKPVELSTISGQLVSDVTEPVNGSFAIEAQLMGGETYWLGVGEPVLGSDYTLYNLWPYSYETADQ